MLSQLVRKLHRRLFGPTSLEVLLEAEREASSAAEQYANREPKEGAADEPEWMRTITLDDPIMPVEEMRWLKKRRAILNYGDGFGHGHATESDMDCLTQEERDRLEAIEIQVRWDQFLGRPKGVDVRPGRYYP